MNYEYLKKLINDIIEEKNSYVSLLFIKLQIEVLSALDKITDEQKTELLNLIGSPIEEQQTPVE